MTLKWIANVDNAAVSRFIRAVGRIERKLIVGEPQATAQCTVEDFVGWNVVGVYEVMEDDEIAPSISAVELVAQALWRHDGGGGDWEKFPDDDDHHHYRALARVAMAALGLDRAELAAAISNGAPTTSTTSDFFPVA